MNLSLEDGINSGIYRTAFSHVNGIPEIREVDDEYSIRKICDKLIKEDGIQDIPTRTYFPTIDEFLEAWKTGYTENKSQWDRNPAYRKFGFEMFYINWKPSTEFFEIGNHKGIKNLRERMDLNPIMILADNNGMNDLSYLNLGVSDFRTQKVLIFREQDISKRRSNAVDLTPNTKKLLIEQDDNFSYYEPGENRGFPLTPPNTGKSYLNRWTAVGINPLSIYEAIENMGFVFPKNQNL